MAPMVVVVPSSSAEVETGIHQTPTGQDVEWAVWVDDSLANPPAAYVTEMLDDLDSFVSSTGDYPYPALTAYLFQSNRSMEYAGATTSAPSALGHEVFHSFWARGLEPATYADGWIDEAWTMFNTYDSVAFIPVAFNWGASPVLLHDPHPFTRVTPTESYSSGRALFAGLADLMGLDELRTAMADFYAQGPVPRSITTAELERHLYCESGELAEVRQAFHRFVYDQQGNAPAPPNNYCP